MKWGMHNLTQRRFFCDNDIILTISNRYDAACYFTACHAGRITTGCTSSCMGRCLSHPVENIIYELYCCIQILTIPSADFIGQTVTSGSVRLRRVTWSEFISTVCRMTVYSSPSWKTAIVWKQPYSSIQGVRRVVHNVLTGDGACWVRQKRLYEQGFDFQMGGRLGY